MRRRTLLKSFVASLLTSASAKSAKAEPQSMPDIWALRWPAAWINFNQGETGSVSRFGGMPDVPKDFAWPSHQSKPLDFLLQIDLAAISNLHTGLDLPEDGRLLFFYDIKEQPWGFRPEDKPFSRVVYIDGGRELIPKAAPDGRIDLPSRGAAFTQIETVPDPWSPWLDEFALSAEQRFELGERQAPLYHNVAQLDGQPYVIQNSMEAECELASSGINVGGSEPYSAETRKKAELEAREWRLLLQLPSDEALGTMWGDSGTIYFWIKQDALKRRDFSKVWLILQCY